MSAVNGEGIYQAGEGCLIWVTWLVKVAVFWFWMDFCIPICRGKLIRIWMGVLGDGENKSLRTEESETFLLVLCFSLSNLWLYFNLIGGESSG